MRLVILLGLALLGCAPTIDVDTWRVAGPRLLAVRAEPAEAAPGKPVTLTALVVDAHGELSQTEMHWSACNARPALAEQAPVAATCVTDDSAALTPVAIGNSATWTVPDDVCGQFGPNPPVAAAGQPAGRPADPDATGGWYAPIRVSGPLASSDVDFFRVRLRCPLAGTTQQQAAAFQQGYRTNSQPAIAQLALVRGTVETPFAATETVVAHAGETLTWRVRWPDCGQAAVCGDGHCDVDERVATDDPDLHACSADCLKPKACGGAERYLRFDVVTRSLVIQREAVTAAFYTTDGVIHEAVTGREATDSATTADSPWTAPGTAGDAWLWVVLRDDRGGVGWQGWHVVIEP